MLSFYKHGKTNCDSVALQQSLTSKTEYHDITDPETYLSRLSTVTLLDFEEQYETNIVQQ